ncbi:MULTISPECIES: hypothetical protein [unclassified Caballeronia]|uniref:hypothetical protein n=1 Tax=unclassified Caballeronia TaxID=2646786 RepID=UPI00285B0A9D|nr:MULTISPECIES: hypothetical protein [unclassified Caballeronia]MDR5752619.1 hypothetical protein [Caballeronia sp. LZ024]MDR5841622.1 hypothetical protein [Caballeronia sp. LZ031]
MPSRTDPIHVAREVENGSRERNSTHDAAALARRFSAIFNGRDDRLIVLLRIASGQRGQPLLLHWVDRLRGSYGDDLEIALLTGTSDPAGIYARSDSTPDALPLVAEICRSASKDDLRRHVPQSNWALKPTSCTQLEAFPRVARDYLESRRGAADLGWLIPFDGPDSLDLLDETVLYAAADRRRTILDMTGQACVSGEQVRLARLVTEYLIHGANPVGGVAIRGISAASPEATLRVDATEAVIDEFANAVRARRVSASTRASLPLRRRL